MIFKTRNYVDCIFIYKQKLKCSSGNGRAFFQLQQQSSFDGSRLSKCSFSGGKNSSTGKRNLSKKSHGLLSVESIHSQFGMQQSITGTISSVSLSRRTMVNKPIVIKSFLPSSESTIISSNTRQISSGTDDTSVSPQQQLQSSLCSTTLVARTMGSITSVCDSFLMQEFFAPLKIICLI